MSISLTEAAAARVRQFVAAQNDAIGLRFGVRKNGCSGWAYTVDVATGANVDDAVFEQHGVKVLVDAKSLAVVDGTEIDFTRQGLNRIFTFRNPKVVGECGCGESFSVDRAAI